MVISFAGLAPPYAAAGVVAHEAPAAVGVAEAFAVVGRGAPAAVGAAEAAL